MTPVAPSGTTHTRHHKNGSAVDPVSVAAVVVHYRSFALTQRTVDALLSCDTIDRTVVVLHDAYPLERDDRIDWIESENRGYAAGVNLAIQHLLAGEKPPENIFVLNPDVKLEPHQITRLVADHTERNSACTFPVLLEHGELLYGYSFSRFGSLKRVQNDPQWYSGACFVLRVDAWKNTGGFEESYFHYFEDQDFCWRMKKEGLVFRQASGVVFEHATKSGADYPATELPRFAVRNHLIALNRAGSLGIVSFGNVITRHLLYMLRWRCGWRGIPQWLRGISEFISARPE